MGGEVEQGLVGIPGEQWVPELLLEVDIPDMQGVQGLLGIHPLQSPSFCSALYS